MTGDGLRRAQGDHGREAGGAARPRRRPMTSIRANSIAPYRDRRFAVGEAMYGHIGIPREDKAARRRVVRAQFPVLRRAGGVVLHRRPARWGRRNGATSACTCRTSCCSRSRRGWRRARRNAGRCIRRRSRRLLGTPAERMLFCGMAIGYEDTDRAREPLAQPRGLRKASG